MKPQFKVEQKITPIVNKYKVFVLDEQGNKAQLIAFAQQKRLKLKEKVIFYADGQKSQPIFSFRAEKVMDVHGKYFVEDVNGGPIGMFSKDFTKSLTSSTWYIHRNEQQAILINEKNPTVATLRRFAGLIPIFGDIVDIVFGFIKYHFTFTDIASNQIVGEYIKTTLFRDQYEFRMNDDYYQTQDWRVLVAMAVALDALQSR